MKVLAAIASLFGIGFVCCLAWALITSGDLNETREVLSSTQVELAKTAAELADTEDRLAETENELADTREELDETGEELADAKSELVYTRVELASTADELSRAESSLDRTAGQLAETREELTTATETLEGLGITLYDSFECNDVKLVDNSQAKNPTWAELKAFLAADRTEDSTYVRDVYDCSQFSRDLHNNAEAVGIRAAEVQVWWDNANSGHALNAFITSDYGLVYIDCTGGPDLAARVKVGKVYRGLGIQNVVPDYFRNDGYWDGLSYYYYIPAGYSGEARTGSIKIYW